MQSTGIYPPTPIPRIFLTPHKKQILPLRVFFGAFQTTFFLVLFRFTPLQFRPTPPHPCPCRNIIPKKNHTHAHKVYRIIIGIVSPEGENKKWGKHKLEDRFVMDAPYYASTISLAAVANASNPGLSPSPSSSLRLLMLPFRIERPCRPGPGSMLGVTLCIISDSSERCIGGRSASSL